MPKPAWFKHPVRSITVLLSVILVLAIVLVYSTTYARRYTQNLHSLHAATATEDFGKLMRKRAKQEGIQYTENMSVVEITDSDSWMCCGYAVEHISVEIAGQAPSYEGTVIRCKAHNLDGSAVLTVTDLSTSEWTIEYPEVPPRWVFWK